ncbi:MAG: hypothetical protein WC785_09905 [Tatlockia sp.]|jgi:hypothetical protein
MPDNEREKAVKKSLQDEVIAKQNAIKDEVNPIKAQQAAVKKAERVKNKEGKAFWDIVIEKGDSMINKNVAGYNDWPIVMMDLMYAGLDIARAMWHDPIGPGDLIDTFIKRPGEIITRPLPYREEIAGGIQQLGTAAWRRVCQPVQRAFLVGDDMLPPVTFDAIMTTPGQIKTAVFKDGQPAPLEMLQHFDAGVTAWADRHGYKGVLDEDTNSMILTKDGNPMTQDEFRTLSNHPDKGLQAYLSDRFELPLQLQAKL